MMKKIKREGWEKKIESIDEISQGLLIKQNKNKKKTKKIVTKKISNYSSRKRTPEKKKNKSKGRN